MERWKGAGDSDYYFICVYTYSPFWWLIMYILEYIYENTFSFFLLLFLLVEFIFRREVFSRVLMIVAGNLPQQEGGEI